MGWFTLVPDYTLKERCLQNLFDAWSDNRDGWLVAGVPDWMDQFVGHTERPWTAMPEGYRFQPDGIWRGEHASYLLELKRAAKYEPLALAEVLHHAQVLEAQEPGVRVKPVIISSYSPWIRRSMRYLLDHGLNSESVAFYEAYPLRDPHSGERILWLDAPLAPWRLGAEPRSFLPSSLVSPSVHWHIVQETDTCIGSHLTDAERPLFQSECVTTTPVSREEGTFLVWVAGETMADAGSYFLWRESEGDPELPAVLRKGLPVARPAAGAKTPLDPLGEPGDGFAGGDDATLLGGILYVPGQIRCLTLRDRRDGPGQIAFFEIHSNTGGVMPAIAFPDVVKMIRERLKEGGRGRFQGTFVEEESDDGEMGWRLVVAGLDPE